MSEPQIPGSETPQPSRTRPPRPREFYRTEHPDLFSDSITDETPSLGEDELKFHLDQLTVERREREFEEFARAVAEKEICPNLMPQTGPVGGGDSKTDSSTYPVAQQLAERRFWSSSGRPADDEWAFAISAKRAWQEKMKSDVAKIAGLSRYFAKIFFVTNQPVSDKIREKWETKIREKYGRDIRILDRTWLVERVFKGHNVELAVAKLGLDVRMLPKRRLGPNDARREADLTNLLNALRNPDLDRRDDYSLAEDYLEAAKLASELERPRSEVDGLFSQARRLAENSGDVGLTLRAHYQHAWRSYFWLDDPNQTEAIYNDMEPLLKFVSTGEECELYSNICSILQTARVYGYHQIPIERETARVAQLKTRLAELASDLTRPNAALFAKTLLVEWRMKENLGNREVLGKVIDDYLECFHAGDGLATYPLLRFLEAIEELGQVFCTLSNYDSFQEKIQDLVAKRCGAREMGLRQLKYGMQLLEKRRNCEALAQLSKGHFNLMKQETLIESGRASLALGLAYHYLCYLWAGRMCILASAHIALHSVQLMRENPTRGFVCAIRMAWLELQIGRLAPFLAWRNLSHGLFSQMTEIGQDTEIAAEELERQDGCLGCFFLKLSTEEAREFRDLIPTLKRMGLVAGRLGLLYSLGEKASLIAELSLTGDEVDKLMQSWRGQPAYTQMAGAIIGETRTNCRFETTLLGVRYRIRCKNILEVVLYAESVLGMLEAVFADARWENFAFVVDSVDLWITTDDSGGNPPALVPELFGIEEHPLIWRSGMIEWIRNNRRAYTEHLYDFLMKLLLFTTVDAEDDIRTELNAWEANGVFDRVGTAAASCFALIDLLGKNLYDLNHWINSAASS